LNLNAETQRRRDRTQRTHRCLEMRDRVERELWPATPCELRARRIDERRAEALRRLKSAPRGLNVVSVYHSRLPDSP
jgi:hypothetical protein